MREASTRIESCPRNSDASSTASANLSFNFLTSGWFAASTGLGPSAFFFTGGFGAPGAAAPAFCAASFAATTRAFAASTCASFSASAEREDGEVARGGRVLAGASVGDPESGGLPSCAIKLSYHTLSYYALA